jgi:hypothetical protein
MQHTVVILPFFFIQLCRFANSNRIAAPHTYTGQNRSAQQAADNDEYCTAVSRACTLQYIATIGPTNLTHVKNLYTPTVPSLGYPHPSSFPNHQTYILPGNICGIIRHAACNKGAGINANY